MANPRVITTTVLDPSMHRCILLTLSLDDDAIVVKVRKHGPVLLFADEDAHRKLRELALDEAIPQYKGDSDNNAVSTFFGELARSVSELAPADTRALPATPRRIAVALTVDAEHLLIEAPPRLPMRLRPDRTFAALRELIDDTTIPDVTSNAFNARRFFRGAGAALGELSKDEKA